jgi:uncharacterized RDD family membrane protein YckC
MALAEEHTATPGRRVGAWFGDLIINILVTSLIVNAGWTFTIATLAIGLYRFLCVGIWGETLGYRLANIRVVRYDDGESVPTWKQSLIRVGVFLVLPLIAIFMPDAIGSALAVLGVLWALVLVFSITSDEESRGLHDRFSETAVIRVSS